MNYYETVKQSLNLNKDSQPQHRFPQAILSVSREELEGLELTVKKGLTDELGTLPDDLQGHVFIIGPVGSFTSPKVAEDKQKNVILPSHNGWTPLYNGDGMVYRLTFASNHAKLTSKLIKTPCYYADLATQDPNKKYQELAFFDIGITRLSPQKLGLRNQLNTAFVPFKSTENNSERLLVTWDSGRSYEIDPNTLKLIAPIGKNQNWQEINPVVQPLPFKQVISSAHPCYDPHTNEVFSVNVGKSLSNLMNISRSISNQVNKLTSLFQNILKQSSINIKFQKRLISWLTLFFKVIKFLEEKSQQFTRNNFVHLMYWDCEGIDIQRKWNVVLADGSPLNIEQTVHQMGITRDYIILGETSFKLAVENFLPYQTSQIDEDIKILLQDILDYPQLPFTKIYIINRKDLQQSKNQHKRSFPLFNNKSPKIPTVVATEVKIEPECAHYLVDYENPDGVITLHVSHLAASDVSKCIRVFDKYACQNKSNNRNLLDSNKELQTQNLMLSGIPVSPMDVSRLGCWVIDGNAGKIVTKHLVDDPKITWSTAFYAWDRPRQKHTDIFWNSWGCSINTLTKRNFDAYKDYPHRKIPVEKVLELTYQGIPSNLCHLHIDRETSQDNPQVNLEIKSYYQFPSGMLGTSTQFVPCPDAQDQTDGYLVSVVITSDEFLSDNNDVENNLNWSINTEIWIFDARKLADGPIYRLSHSKLNMGFTFHTTWLKEAISPPARDYDIKEDYDYLIQQQTPELRDKIQDLFNKEVYPNFSAHLEC